MLRVAETFCAPPAKGVIVRAVELPTGLMILRTELGTLVVINVEPKI